MPANFTNHGSETFTADALLGSANNPCRVYSATWLSGGTAGVLVLRNGQTVSGTVIVQQGGVISETVTQNWEDGLKFPNGCFFDKGTNVTSVTIEFRNEK